MHKDRLVRPACMGHGLLCKVCYDLSIYIVVSPAVVHRASTDILQFLLMAKHRLKHLLNVLFYACLRIFVK